ncbi:hypothetical protein T492DRAFT_881014 [Pavlovales sp. CCMP2436]|nr:hypothetical protein T492DRAFT_881014 [Pavlovales sp. CCMP2436]
MGACNTAPSRETTLPLRRHGVDSSAPDVPLPIYNPVPGYACFKAIEPVSYYWMMFAVLTLCWEICYITFKFDETRKYADYLKASGTHVWFTYYGWDMILPWNTALVFYGEYGAWADREYSALRMVYSSWARIIEGSHGISAEAPGFSV